VSKPKNLEQKHSLDQKIKESTNGRQTDWSTDFRSKSASQENLDLEIRYFRSESLDQQGYIRESESLD